jgi:hypothetical protein
MWLEMEPTKRFPKLVHFFGPDGAGKSTQVDILVGVLRERGINAQKCWVRAHHTVAFLLWRLFIRIGFCRSVLNPFGVATRIPAVDQNRFLRFFWSTVEFIGVLPHILRVHYSLWRGRTLVAERYILDTITTTAYFLNDISFLRSCTSRILLFLIPHDTVFIFLDANYETIYQRRAHLFRIKIRHKRHRREYGAIPASSVEPRFFIDFQRAAYKILSRSFDTLVINTSENSIEETSMAIRQKLGLN